MVEAIFEDCDVRFASSDGTEAELHTSNAKSSYGRVLSSQMKQYGSRKPRWMCQ
jgi:hypothetical protein